MKLRNRIKYYLYTGAYMLKLELQGQMEYPSFLVGWFLSNALQFAVGIGTLKVITIQFETINGWTFNQIAFMYGMGIMSHALAIILFIQTWSMEYFVRHGEFDRMLLRPMNVYYQFCVCTINLIGLSDMLPGIIIFTFGAVTTGFHFSLLNTLYLIIIIIGAVMIRGGIYTIIGSVAFFTKSSSNLINVVGNLFDKSIIYPMSIYSKTIQGLLTFLLPLGFIAYYPASSFLGKDVSFKIPGPVPLWTLGVGILLMLFGYIMFRMGLRHYDSSGN